MMVVTFPYSRNEKWYVDEQNKEVFRETRKKDWMDLRRQEEIACELGLYATDETLVFEDESMALEWADTTTKLGNNKFKFLGKIWWLDQVMLEAYTEEGIKEIFSPGQQGHVKKAIEKDGTYVHDSKLVSEATDYYRGNYPVEDEDEDDYWEDPIPMEEEEGVKQCGLS